MYAPLIGRLACLAALLLLLSPAPAQEEGASLREIQVKEILAKCNGAKIPEIWRNADELAKLGPPAKRTIQRALQGTGVEGRLAALRALIELAESALSMEAG